LTARVGASQLQISNQPELRVIRKVELETYLRAGKPW
jgi:archaeosine-15-forming tRNA-guanine transglycosylase